MRRALAITALAALMVSCWPSAGPAAGQTPSQRAAERLEAALESLKHGKRAAAWQELEAARKALWPGLKLGIRSLTMIKSPATGYGMYTPRSGNAYSIMGEPIYIYLEPVGYALAAGDEGESRFALSMDARLLDLDGRELFTLDDFMRQTIYSRRFKGEFFLNVTLNIDGAPPGSYVVQLTLKDLVGGKKATAKLPIRFLSPSAIAAENRRLAAEAASKAHKAKSVDKGASVAPKPEPASVAPLPPKPPAKEPVGPPGAPSSLDSQATPSAPAVTPAPKDAAVAAPAPTAPRNDNVPAGSVPTGTQ